MALGYKSASAFARMVAVTPQAIISYENAIRRPEIDKAILIVRATSVTLDWIYLGVRNGLPHQLAVVVYNLK